MTQKRNLVLISNHASLSFFLAATKLLSGSSDLDTLHLTRGLLGLASFSWRSVFEVHLHCDGYQGPSLLWLFPSQ